MIITKHELTHIYLRAKTSFIQCITNEENRFLRDEVEVPLESLILKEDYIIVKYQELNISKYHIEAKLNIVTDGGGVLGRYHYYENEQGEQFDDVLVFD